MENQTTQPQQAPMQTPPPNYLVFSILVTIFCCLIGVVSIIYAAQVNSKWSAGDYAGAVESSKNAKKWAWITLGIGIFVGILSLVFGVFAGLMSRNF
jgi:ABC-type Fe3+ transport system permease subunit